MCFQGPPGPKGEKVKAALTCGFWGSSFCISSCFCNSFKFRFAPITQLGFVGAVRVASHIALGKAPGWGEQEEFAKRWGDKCGLKAHLCYRALVSH